MKPGMKQFKSVKLAYLIMLMSSLAGLIKPGYAETTSSVQQQVWQAELAFARTMAARDLQGFSNYIAEEAIFFNGNVVLRGKAKVVAQWASYFKEKDAPFSWQPDQVEVLDSAKLALSTGLVRDTQGKVFARFNSVWRLEADGKWRVVFDKGSPASAAEQASQSQCCSKTPALNPSLKQIL